MFDSADLSIIASDSPDPVRIGTDVTYNLSIANIIASGLFGDGAAAMVMSGDRTGPHDGPRVVASALARIAAGPFAGAYLPLLVFAGAAWSGAFALFLLVYGPMLLAPRAASAPITS